MFVDSENPYLEIISPDNQAWLQNILALSVKSEDENGIKKVEYSLNNGESWTEITHSETEDGIYNVEVEMNGISEGLVEVIIKATGNSGKTSEKIIVIFKDITPPTVEVITPALNDSINGETRFSLKVTDNGKIVSGWYILDPENEEDVANEATSVKTELSLDSLVTFMVGTASFPLNNNMIFSFTDASGNVNNFNTLTYIIDAEEDEPVIEIHVPEENAIVTKDFVVSGIVYDDDGPSKVWYKIDDGEFIPLDGYGTNYSIEIPLSILTDNEHTITLFAEDMFGVKGKEVTRTVRVSLEEPKGSIDLPTFEQTVSRIIEISPKSIKCKNTTFV